MTKIVRKVDLNGDTIAFWLDVAGEVRAWVDDPSRCTPEEEAESGTGWPAEDLDAELCGTTLAALRDELTEEGKDG